MDLAKYTLVGHRGRSLCCPGTPARVDALLDRLAASIGAWELPRVLDLGCGKGAWLLRLARRAAVRGVGVERIAAFVEEARAESERGAGRLRAGTRLTFVCADFDAAVHAGSYEAAISVGASQIFGHHRDNLRGLRAALVPGGLVLLGEGVWRQEPAAAYLDALGATLDDLLSHEGNQRAAVAEGFTVLHAERCSDEEFEAYDQGHRAAVLAYATAHPEDPDVVPLLARSDAWYAIQERWGRATMGFAYYLLRLDSGPGSPRAPRLRQGP